MNEWMTYQLLATDGNARAGVIKTPRGIIPTPIFMPVGTQGSVKGMDPQTLKEIGASICLGNTYHLLNRPGVERIEKLGGLHRMMNWDRPILTDSGGFQVFSLANLRTLNDEGVIFRSHLDGALLNMTPESTILTQEKLGSDIMMPLDVCPPYPCTDAEMNDAMRRTTAWAKRSVTARQRGALFAIVQGGVDKEQRTRHVNELGDLPVDGFSIGGLSVGEAIPLMIECAEHTATLLPSDKPRYLMGVGTPEDLVACIGAGVDMFDCVMPTRNGRNGMAFTWNGNLIIKHRAHVDANIPLDENCACPTCQRFSRAYLCHLYKSREILAHMAMTTHNLYFYLELMREARAAILEQRFGEFTAEFTSQRSTANEC
jgi:queuine tRNA-ribosyltransferase